MNAIGKSLRVSTFFLTLATVVLVALFIYRLNDLFLHDIRGQSRATDTACVLEDECLFQQAMQAQFIQVDEHFMLRLTPADFRVPDGQRQQEALLQRLHYSPPGRLIQQEVRRWNETRQVAAMRYRTDHPISAIWQPYQYKRLADGNRQNYLLPVGNRVSESFGFVHNGLLRGGFGEWMVATAANQPVMFSGQIRLSRAERLAVQFVGQLQHASWSSGGKQHPVTGRDIEYACPPPADHCTQPKALGGLMTIQLTAGAYPAELKIQLLLQPAINHTSSEDGLRIRIEDNQVVWKRTQRPPRRFGQQYSLVTGKPAYRLTDETGQANACAEQLGLVPVVGIDRGFAFSLNGLFAQSVLPAGNSIIELTIDPMVQQHAHDSLQQGLAPADGKPSRLPLGNKFQRLRRAALVVLDADSGNILAAAGWPKLPPLSKLSNWDSRAYHKIYEKYGHISPLEVQAWQAVTRENTPGSIFKPLVALAAATALQQSNRSYLMQIVQGISAERWHTVHKQGLYPEPKLADGGYKPLERNRPIRNFRSEPLGSYTDAKDPNMGLKLAIRKSINTLFVKLALEMDGANLKAIEQWRMENNWFAASAKSPEQQWRLIDKALQKYPLSLLNTMRRFGIGSEQGPALLDVSHFDSVNWPPAQFQQRVFHAAPSIADITNPRFILRNPLEWPVAQSAIGQAGIQVTPLHVALIMASIAAERKLHARLVKSIAGLQDTQDNNQALNVNPDVLGIIKSGLKAVPVSGTAATAFGSRHDDTPLLYGKTGTADVTINRTKTVWFVGWREAKPDHESRRLAFACMITHVVGRRGTGGSVCAPIVADFFKRLNASREDGKSQPPQACRTDGP